MAFTLIEAVIAISILMILCVEIFYLFSQGSTGTIRVHDEIAAINYATSVLAFCKSLPLSHPLLEESDRRLLQSLSLDDRRIAGLPDDYTCELTVKSRKSAELANYTYKVLVIRITWKSSGVARSISLSDMIYGATVHE